MDDYLFCCYYLDKENVGRVVSCSPKIHKDKPELRDVHQYIYNRRPLKNQWIQNFFNDLVAGIGRAEPGQRRVWRK